MLKLKTWSDPVTYRADGVAITMQVKRLAFAEAKQFAVEMSKVRRDRVVKHALLADAEERRRKLSVLERENAALVAAGHEAVPIGDDLDATQQAIEAAITAHGVTVPPMTTAELETLLTQDEGRVRERQEAVQEYLASLDAGWVAGVFEHYVRNVEGVEVDGEAITTGAQLYAVADQGLVLFVLEAVQGLATLSSAEKKASSSPLTSEPAGNAGGASPAMSAEPVSGTAPATAPEPQDTPSSFASANP